MFKVSKQYGGLIAAAIASLVLVATFVLFNMKVEKIVTSTKEMTELGNAREQFCIEWHSRITAQNQNEHIKSLYFNYASGIIREHYLKHPSQTKRQMRPDEVYSLLDTIYHYATSDVFPTVNYPDGLFLPLAFACVETDFYPDAVGDDGERSIFQFMEMTAREVYEKNGKPFVEMWWQVPQECVWLWFNYYRQLSTNFVSQDRERQIRWTALAYNAGLYRNRLIPYFQRDETIESYLHSYPLNKGFTNYNRKVYEVFQEYMKGFNVFQ